MLKNHFGLNDLPEPQNGMKRFFLIGLSLRHCRAKPRVVSSQWNEVNCIYSCRWLKRKGTHESEGGDQTRLHFNSKSPGKKTESLRLFSVTPIFSFPRVWVFSRFLGKPDHSVSAAATEGNGWENLRFRGDRGSWTSRARRRRSLHFDTAGSDIHSLRSHSYFLSEEGGERRDNVLTPPFYKHNATLAHTHARTQKALTNKSRCTKAAVAAEGVFANAQGSAGLFFAVVNVYLTELAC